MTMKKLIATDFDGTFYRHGRISDKDRAAIEKWRGNGGYFGFVTGRGTDFFETIRELGVETDYLLLYNGALLAAPDGTVLREYLIDRDTFAGLELFFAGMPDARSFDRAGEDAFYRQYYALFADPKQALAAAREVNGRFGDRVTAFVNGPHVNIGKKGSGKAQGVYDALEYFGLPSDAAAVFGDDYNDMDMIAAHKGWAVANARPVVIKAASHVCFSVGGAALKLMRKQKAG